LGHEKDGSIYGIDGVVWTSLGPLPRWVPRPITRWDPRLLDLGHTTPDDVGRKDYGGGVLRYEAVHVLYHVENS
jgi:hypothetical protein